MNSLLEESETRDGRAESFEDAMPTVSLILLTFNHNRNVAEAVRGALGRDYPNLEIVLNDHGSTDRTFEIARDLVEAMLARTG